LEHSRRGREFHEKGICSSSSSSEAGSKAADHTKGERQIRRRLLFLPKIPSQLPERGSSLLPLFYMAN
jgi:hypothetical protein